MLMEVNKFIHAYNKMLNGTPISIEDSISIITKYCSLNGKDDSLVA